MKYCSKCGKQLFDEAVFCPGCGQTTPQPQPYNYQYQPYNQQYQPYPPQANANQLVQKLSQRLKVNGIIWIVIAVFQILLGLTGAVWTAVIGVLNIVSAIKDINYSKAVLENPQGIVSNFESLTSPIITLVYNLVVGGIVGVIGSIYYFVALRGFVMENKNAFLALEASQAPQYHP